VVVAAGSVANRILELLPSGERDALLGDSEIVVLKLRDVVANQDTRTRFVYFPIDAILSMMTVLSDGHMMEVGTVGDEGIVGVQLVLGESKAVQEIYCQVPGRAVRVTAERFLDAVGTCPVLAQLCSQYVSGLINFLAQSVACNGLHSVIERCAKWMLMTHDRVRNDRFLLTHEFLAMMLGVRRTGVTLAAGALSQAGFIEYKRGHVHVVDRAGLVASACECYLITKTEFERALRVER
jgi:CRP-like cAMP-binding protein